MTEIIKPTRRLFLTGLFSALAAPAIVRIENIMPVKICVWDGVTPIPEGVYSGWVEMAEYCKNDVVLTFNLYNKFERMQHRIGVKS